MKKNGFTLIELMLVVSIIATLAAIAIPKFADLIRKSNEGSTKGNLGALKGALTVYYAQNEGSYPTDDLSVLTANGRYIEVIPVSNSAPYHPKSSQVHTNASVSEGVSTGGWLYNNISTHANWGALWVNCNHTDTKGTNWNQY